MIGLARGFSVDLFSYLFGSILTVGPSDVYLILTAGLVVAVIMLLFYKEMVYLSFDEEAAKVSGIPVKFLNILFVFLSAIVIAIAIPIVGILLISALLVLPAVTALQLKKSFKETLLWAEFFSLSSVVAGIIASFYLDVSPGGAIVLIMIAIFSLVFAGKNFLRNKYE